MNDSSRARLLKAAERLFADRGFKEVTVIDRVRATNEAATQTGAGHRAEEQLRRSISIFIHRLLSNGSDTVHRLITRELNDPTPALDALIEQGVRPRIDYLSGLVADLIGCDSGDPRVLRCVGSIQTQSIAYLPNPIAQRLGMPATLTPGQIDDIAQHVADFSIAGIKAVAREHVRGRARAGRSSR
ncbi:MAG: hypothetical protein DMF99_09680 [Acidobacteria bacterium]|nr:MAG: hypothetical protein DMF99_09680 [Acidobacteriota bacterium]